jgi:predicted secreted protein
VAGLDGFGAELRRGDGATPTEVFTPIAEATNFSGPGLERDTYDVTTHQSPNRWREFIGGLKDAGEIEVDVNYDPTVHDTLVADLNDSAPRNYEMAWPTEPETVWSIQAILTGFEPEAPHDDKLAASLTFKITGEPTLDESS